MTKSPTAEFLAAAIDASGLTQKEVAQRAGLPKPNVISMMKKGDTKVPIDRIPALSKACNANPNEFLKVAMQEYHAEIWDVLCQIFRVPNSRIERDLILLLSIADPDRKLKLYKEDANFILSVLEYLVARTEHK